MASECCLNRSESPRDLDANECSGYTFRSHVGEVTTMVDSTSAFPTFDAYFNAYGELAARVGDPTVAAGRYPFQKEAEDAIVPEILPKLDLHPEHRLLEIGFGTGRLLTRLASYVRLATGLDHEACVSRLAEAVPDNVTLMDGQWPLTRPAGRFDRILAYSVIQYVGSRTAADRFVDACADSLDDDGVALIGDLPNEDTKRRFTESRSGRRFSSEWRQRVSTCEDPDVALRDELFARATGSFARFIDDAFVLETVERFRRRGLHAYVVPQGKDLPFGHTREDIIIRRPGR